MKDWICKRCGRTNKLYHCGTSGCAHTALHNPLVSKYTFSRDQKGIRSLMVGLKKLKRRKDYPYKKYLEDFTDV